MQSDFTVKENTPDLWKKYLPQPHITDHKYCRGHSVILGGEISHSGAALLSAEAALRVGSGLVTQLVPEKDQAFYAVASKKAIMTRGYEELSVFLEDERANVWLLGPGLGVNEATCRKVEMVLKWHKLTVLDADVLSAFGDKTGPFFESLNEGCLLTPHEGEFERLFPRLKGSKLELAQQAALITGAVILLKGAETVIAHPNGTAIVHHVEAPQLATAGTGDVLAGLCTGLIAQGMEPSMAAAAAVWIHAQAAIKYGRGLIADDLLDMVPQILQKV